MALSRLYIWLSTIIVSDPINSSKFLLPSRDGDRVDGRKDIYGVIYIYWDDSISISLSWYNLFFSRSSFQYKILIKIIEENNNLNAQKETNTTIIHVLL